MYRSSRAEAGRGQERRTGWLALTALLWMALVLSACQRRSRGTDRLADVDLVCTVDPSPAVVGPAQVTFSLTDSTGVPVRIESLRLRADMTHAGMAPLLASGVEAAPGEIVVELDWPMVGDWVLLVQATLADGRELSREISLTVQAAP